MNVFEAQEKLVNWFHENDVVNLEKDFLKIVLVSTDEESDKASLLAGLQLLKETGFIKEVEDKKKKYWILLRPLSTLSQHVELSYLTAHGIAQVVNYFCDKTEDEKSRVTPLNIQEKDIMNMTVILGGYIQNQKNSEKESPPSTEGN